MYILYILSYFNKSQPFTSYTSAYYFKWIKTDTFETFYNWKPNFIFFLPSLCRREIYVDHSYESVCTFLYHTWLPRWLRRYSVCLQCGTRVQSLGWEDLLEKEMATHSSILAWRIPWTDKPSRLQSMGSQRVGHDWITSLHFTSLLHVYNMQYYWHVLKPHVALYCIAISNLLFSLLLKNNLSIFIHVL